MLLPPRMTAGLAFALLSVSPVVDDDDPPIHGVFARALHDAVGDHLHMGAFRHREIDARVELLRLQRRVGPVAER